MKKSLLFASIFLILLIGVVSAIDSCIETDEGIRPFIKGDIVINQTFECKSNVCVSSECVSEGLIKKILNWFKRLFGGE